jgi:hypothetical protein
MGIEKPNRARTQQKKKRKKDTRDMYNMYKKGNKHPTVIKSAGVKTLVSTLQLGSQRVIKKVTTVKVKKRWHVKKITHRQPFRQGKGDVEKAEQAERSVGYPKARRQGKQSEASEKET